MNEQKAIGPFKAIGVALNTVGTTVGAVDNVVSQTDSLLSKGFSAINSIVDNGLADLETDNIVEDAKRQVRIAKANAEAATILATLKPARKVATKTKPKG